MSRYERTRDVRAGAGVRLGFSGGLLVLLILSAAGCLTTKKDPGPSINMNDFVTRSTQLMVTRGTNGTTLAWKSKSSELYTVKIRDGHYKTSRWINHPKLVNIRGTGGRITYRDNPGPTEKRKYSLQVTSLDGSGPRAPKRTDFR